MISQPSFKTDIERREFYEDFVVYACYAYGIPVIPSSHAKDTGKIVWIPQFETFELYEAIMFRFRYLRCFGEEFDKLPHQFTSLREQIPDKVFKK